MQTTRLKKKLIKHLEDLYSQHPNCQFEYDVASQNSLHASDVMISDWSGAAIEYSFALKKPVVFIDLPLKDPLIFNAFTE